jgi:hypothetical protein
MLIIMIVRYIFFYPRSLCLTTGTQLSSENKTKNSPLYNGWARGLYSV